MRFLFLCTTTTPHTRDPFQTDTHMNCTDIQTHIAQTHIHTRPFAHRHTHTHTLHTPHTVRLTHVKPTHRRTEDHNTMRNANQASFSQAVNETRTSLPLFVPREMCVLVVSPAQTHTHTETPRKPTRQLQRTPHTDQHHTPEELWYFTGTKAPTS